MLLERVFEAGPLSETVHAQSRQHGVIIGGWADSSVGDAIRLTADLGIPLGKMTNAWFGEAPVEYALRNSACRRTCSCRLGTAGSSSTGKGAV